MNDSDYMFYQSFLSGVPIGRLPISAKARDATSPLLPDSGDELRTHRKATTASRTEEYCSLSCSTRNRDGHKPVVETGQHLVSSKS
jgi:hypothetical protein